MADLDELAGSMLAGCRPDEQLEIVVARSVRTEVRVHGLAIEALTVAESHGVGARLVCDSREGFAHAGSFDSDVTGNLVAEARDNAAFAEPDERVGLVAPDGQVPASLDTYSVHVESVNVDDKIAMAEQVEQAALDADPRVRGVRTAVYSDVRAEMVILSSAGVRADRQWTTASLTTKAMIDDEQGKTRSGAAVDSARSPLDLDPGFVGRTAVDRAIALVGATSPASERIPVILEPRFTSSILGIVAGMLSGERVVKGRTPFARRLDEAIASKLVTLLDDPTSEESLGASRVDGEGLACRPLTLINDGVLTSFLHDARSGRGCQASSTASARRGSRSRPSPGHRALTLMPGEGDLESFIVEADDAFLVASLQGVHSGVNAVSGDLSVGVEGIRIRHGQRAEPIREATLAGAIPRMIQDIRRIGADVERLPSGAAMPSLVMDGLTLSGAATA